MKNPIEPSFKTERFSIFIVFLSFLAACYFYPFFTAGLAIHFDTNGNADRFVSDWLVSGVWPIIIIGQHIMFLLLPYLNINRRESSVLKTEWHSAKELSLSFLFITQVVSELILSGQDGILIWALPILLLLMIISFRPTVSKVIKTRKDYKNPL